MVYKNSAKARMDEKIKDVKRSLLMKRLNKLLIHLTWNNDNVLKELDGEKVRDINKDIVKKDDYNVSYYGDPHAYDWHNPELEDVYWRRR